jgi:hypothetical protein
MPWVNSVYRGDNSDEYISGVGTRSEFIDGSGGKDSIFAKAGNDTVIGNFGNDLLNGGWNNDLFFFGSNHGYDYIQDFGREAENLDLIALGGGLDFYTVTPTRVGVKITAIDTDYQGLGPRTDTIFLQGVSEGRWERWGGDFGTFASDMTGDWGGLLIDFNAPTPVPADTIIG